MPKITYKGEETYSGWDHGTGQTVTLEHGQTADVSDVFAAHLKDRKDFTVAGDSKAEKK